MRRLADEFRHFRGQPIEVIQDNGARYCGIDVDSDDDSVTLVDDCGRLVRLESRHIDAFIQPQMKLRRLCDKNDCDCDEEDEEDDDCHNGCNERRFRGRFDRFRDDDKDRRDRDYN